MVDAVMEKKQINKRNDEPSRPRCRYSTEENNSITKEARAEAAARLKYHFDNSDVTFPTAIKKAVREQLEEGFPVSYGDGNGNVLRRYPDGRIFVVERNMETFEKTETFLRMATVEDNIGIYN